MKALKWIGIVLGGLFALLAVVIIELMIYAQAANLTPAERLPLWSEAEFIATVREGQAPGRRFSDGMPRYQMNDEDLAAIFMYLGTLEPVETSK